MISLVFHVGSKYQCFFGVCWVTKILFVGFVQNSYQTNWVLVDSNPWDGLPYLDILKQFPKLPE
jgi:hypothetical protein